MTDSHQQTFWVIFAAIFVAMLGVGVIAPTMPIYAETLGATGFWLGMIYASFSISRLIFMPLAGRLSDIKGRKIFIVMGLSVYALASLGYVWSESVLQITWIRFLHGIGSAMVIPIATAVIGDISPSGREGRMMGNFQVALFLGFGVGPLLGGAVMQLWSVTHVFYVMGGMSILSLILIQLFLKESEAASNEKTKPPCSLNCLWQISAFKGLFCFRFSNAVGRAAILSFLPIFADHVHVTPAQIGFLVSLNILLTSILQKPFGILADKMSRGVQTVAGNMISSLALILIVFAADMTDLIVIGSIMGIGSALAFPAAGAQATELGRDFGMGNVMGYFNMAMSVGSILGSLVAGLIMDILGLEFVFIFGGCVGFLGSLGSWYFMRLKR